MTLVALGAGFAAVCLLLGAADVVSWRRTTGFRHGAPGPSGTRARRTAAGPRGEEPWPLGHPPGFLKSSPTTFLAAGGGCFAVAWGLAAVASRHIAAIAIVCSGAFVAVAGLRGRVTGLGVQGAGLRVHYRAKPSVFVSWASLRAVHSPGGPFGAWRLDTVWGPVRLMPSDLLGHDDVLRTIVQRSVLTFDGRVWRTARVHPGRL